MRPLFLDFPSDEHVWNLYRRAADAASPANEYMLGNALLVRPLFQDGETSVSTYFPGEANYVSLFTGNGEIFAGNQHHKVPVAKSPEVDYPIFLKEGEILLIDDYETGAKKAYFLLTTNGSATQPYTMHLSPTRKVVLKPSAMRAGSSS